MPQISPQEIQVIIGEKISAARHKRGEKCTTVAKAVGLSHTVISQIENGRYYSLKVTTLITIAVYLEIPIKELMLPSEI